jgi:hypothetical protein
MELAKGNLLNIGRIPGAVIRVEEGAIWLTQECDIADHVLRAGESRRLEGRGTAIVTALKDSSFQIVAPTPAGGTWSALLAALLGGLRAGA